jgi:CBS domain-containing protein
MKVQDILKAKGDKVETIRSDATVGDAARKLTSLGIGALIVSEDGEQPEGIISERDVVRGLNRHGYRLLDMEVGEVMTKTVAACSPDDSIKRVMQEMTRGRNRHLAVVEGGRLQGVVSIGDVVKNRLDELELEAAVLRDINIARS